MQPRRPRAKRQALASLTSPSPRQPIAAKSTETEALLVPTLALLRSSGFSESAACALFLRAWKRAEQFKEHKNVQAIDPNSGYAEIVARWSRDRRFLQPDGSPRLLTMQGRAGIRVLIRSVSPSADAREVLSVLCRFGTVRHVGQGRYKLIWPFFSVASTSNFAFEPSANFLADASATVMAMLERRREPLGTGPFWRVADSTCVPEEHIEDFYAFLRRRSLPFLEEIDDWLQSHSASARPRKRGIRMGLGLFSIATRRVVRLR